MADHIIKISEDFWNIRGSFRIFGLVNIGTHTSLVRIRSGRYVLLDSYALSGEVADEVLKKTNQGKDLHAVINLHPFHTVHVPAIARMFPEARLYGTSRHRSKFGDLDWQPEETESAAFSALFAEDFVFSVPRGVDFVPADENLHFASVLALHQASKTLHVDDTFNWISIPLIKKLSFHPTLAKVLEPRADAAHEFRDWAEELIDVCGELRNVCAAHIGASDLRDEAPGTIAGHMRDALKGVETTLHAHERKF